MEQDNKMTSSNLGIVFGPTLMRPRPTDATISLSSLVDYPHQARIIEALIIFYSTIFEHKESAALPDAGKHSTDGKEAAASPDLVGVPGERSLRGCGAGRDSRGQSGGDRPSCSPSTRHALLLPGLLLCPTVPFPSPTVPPRSPGPADAPLQTPPRSVPSPRAAPSTREGFPAPKEPPH